MSLEKIQPSTLRKYLVEYTLIALTGCVVFLFLSLNDLNKFIRTDLLNQRDNLMRTVDRNTDALNQLNRTEKNYSPIK